MSNRQVSTSVYLHPDQLARLRKLSTATGAPVAALVRRGVDRVLADAEAAHARLAADPALAAVLSPDERALIGRCLGYAEREP